MQSCTSTQGFFYLNLLLKYKYLLNLGMNLKLLSNKIFFKSLLLTFLLSLNIEAKATHLMGSDIYIQKVSALKYKVTYKLYRECAGVPLNGLVFKLYNNSKSDTIICTRTSIKDISLKCSQDTSPCSPSNSTSNPGVEEHVYVRVIDFSDAKWVTYNNPNDCFVSFSVETCCRDGNITTIVAGNYYSESRINLCMTEKVAFNEIEFSSHPVQYLCCNNTFYYSNGILFNASKSDSLSFTLDTPMNARNSFEQYNSGHSALKPLTTVSGQAGFGFQANSGDFLITPNVCSQVGVIVVKCKNWHIDSNGVRSLLAEYRREFEMIVRNCAYNNFAPYFIGSNAYSICEGNKLCINVTSKDDPYFPNQIKPDTIDISYKTSIPRAELSLSDSNSREKIVNFCWQSEDGDARVAPYILTLRADDDKCGNPMYSYKTITIKVKPKPKVRREYTFLSNARMKMESIIIDNSVNYGSYIFTIFDSLNQIKFNSFDPLDTFTFQFPGKYVIFHRVYDKYYNCPTVFYDTIVITKEFLNSISNDKIYRELNLYPNPSNGIINVQLFNHPNEGDKVFVYNNFGQLIKSFEYRSNRLDLSDLNSGNYYIQIVSESSIYSGKVILLE